MVEEQNWILLVPLRCVDATNFSEVSHAIAANPRGKQNPNRHLTFVIIHLLWQRHINGVLASWAEQFIRGSQLPFSAIGKKLLKLDTAGRAKFVTAAWETIDFTYSDYGDLLDFVNLLEKAEISGFDHATLSQVKNAVSQFVISNQVTEKYERASGVAFWLPYSLTDFKKQATKYRELKFDAQTQWADALEFALQEAGR